MTLLIEMIGWLGSACVVLAYALNSYQKLRSDSILFLLLNLGGGLMLLIYTVYKDALASAFVNLVWVGIAVVAIVRYSRKNR